MSDRRTGPPTREQVFGVTAVTMLLFIGAGAGIGNRPEAVVLLLLEMMVAVPAMMFAAVTSRSFGRLFRFRKPGFPGLAAAAVIGAGMKPVFDEGTILIASLFPMPPDIADALARALIWDNPAEAVVLFLAAVPAAALAEEMLFRGFIQTSLERSGYRDRAVYISALLFALLHLNPWWFIQIVLMGVALGFIAMFTDSIWPAAAAHGVFNLAGLLVSNAGTMSAIWYTETGHVSPLLIIAGAGVAGAAFVWLRRMQPRRELNA
ncbi:CPBP family intramembrane metalloprotease [bacterium]|nr:CPBP family intramembrane metalloprotease [bacterium]